MLSRHTAVPLSIDLSEVEGSEKVEKEFNTKSLFCFDDMFIIFFFQTETAEGEKKEFDYSSQSHVTLLLL